MNTLLEVGRYSGGTLHPVPFLRPDPLVQPLEEAVLEELHVLLHLGLVCGRGGLSLADKRVRAQKW